MTNPNLSSNDKHYSAILPQPSAIQQYGFESALKDSLSITMPVFAIVGAVAGFIFGIDVSSCTIIGAGAGACTALAIASVYKIFRYIKTRFDNKQQQSASIATTNTQKSFEIYKNFVANYEATTGFILENSSEALSTSPSVFSSHHPTSSNNTDAANISKFLSSAFSAVVMIILSGVKYFFERKKPTNANDVSFSSSISSSINYFIFFLAILIPMGAALGIGISHFFPGNFHTVITTILLSLGTAIAGSGLFSLFRYMQEHKNRSTDVSSDKQAIESGWKAYEAACFAWSAVLLPVGTAIGAAIGTFLFPGLGTVAGGALGGAAASVLGMTIGYFHTRKNCSSSNDRPSAPYSGLNTALLTEYLKSFSQRGATLGAGLGAILGNFVFPGIGTLPGMLIGAGIGALAGATIAIATSMIMEKFYPAAAPQSQKVQQSKTNASLKLGLNRFNLSFVTGAALGAGIGAIVGTFVFPGIGTLTGAAAGAAIGGIVIGASYAATAILHKLGNYMVNSSDTSAAIHPSSTMSNAKIILQSKTHRQSGISDVANNSNSRKKIKFKRFASLKTLPTKLKFFLLKKTKKNHDLANYKFSENQDSSKNTSQSFHVR